MQKPQYPNPTHHTLPFKALALAWMVATAGLPTPSSAQTAVGPLAAPAVATSALPDMTSIAAKLSPSVVNISVQGVRKVSTSARATNPDGEGTKGSTEELAAREYLRKFQQRLGELPPQLNMPVRG